jgi:1-acyl-sn-glycerol-3-phosphate acyltransferase
MTPNPRSAPAPDVPIIEETSSEPARLKRALAERLSEIERRIEDAALEPEQPASGAVEQFVGDLARETRDAGARLWTRLARPRELASRVLAAVATLQADLQDGVDAALRDAVSDAVRPIARGWFGLKVRADVPLPHRGGLLIAMNRSGWPLPTEAVIVASALAERARRRDVYVLWSGDLLAAPGVSTLFRRLGVLPIERGEARRLLGAGAMVIAFPEGAAASEKNYTQRYRISAFADDYLVEETRDAGAALVPGAIVGHEESHPVLARIAGIPVTPTFPFTGALGLVPLPLGWKIRIGVPLHTDDRGGSNEALAGQLRGRMQGMLSEMVAERHSIVRG